MTAKILIALLLLLTIYGIQQYFRTQHYIQIGVDLADKAIPYEQHPANPTLKILTIGDSSVVGTGATPESSVAGRLGKDFPQADIVNLGVNGTRTPALVERFEVIRDQRFDLILIHTGGNDIVNFTPFKVLEENLVKVLDIAKEMSPKVIVLHSGNVGTSRLFPWPTRWIFTQRTRIVRNIFLRITEEKSVDYVDLWRLGKADPFYTEPEKYYSPDNFHPSGDGYGDWYEHIKKSQSFPEAGTSST